MKHCRAFTLLLLSSLLTAGVGCSRGAAESRAAETPDQAIEHVVQSIADGKLDVVWQSLPPSYRGDVTSVIHEAASQMDAALWNRTFTVLQKANRILEEKRTFILDHPMLAASIKDRSEAEEGWDSVVGIFDVIVNSDLADLGKVRNLDVERFLGDTGQHLWSEFEEAAKLAPGSDFEKAMNDLRATEATVLSTADGTARVRIETPGKPAREEDYVQVEGYWVPAEMADEWDTKMSEARQKIAELSGEQGESRRQAALMQLGMIESVLDNLHSARTAEEFHAGLGAAMGAVAGATISMSNSASPAGTAYTMGR